MILNGFEHSLEIEITTECNLACLNCNRSCRQAPSKEHMTLDQIRKFIEESKKFNVVWNKGVALLGGEPTLHPDIDRIIIELYRGLDRQIRFLTNGVYISQRTNLFKYTRNIVKISSDKTSIYNWFVPFNMAPIDDTRFKEKDVYNYCKVIYDCGLGLSRYGFYVCGQGASIDRIFGFDIGIKSLRDVNLEALYYQRKILCPYCGLLPFGDYDPYKNRITNEEKISPSWEEAYKKYKKSNPIMGLY
jgi:hypothetical protein